jgi:hypothetical protein
MPLFSKDRWICKYRVFDNTVTKVCKKKIKYCDNIKTTIPKNHISILPGYGRSAIDVNYNANDIEIKDNKSFILGIGYSRTVYDNLSLGVQIFSNKDSFLDIGFHF